jgi:hypothetical protein
MSFFLRGIQRLRRKVSNKALPEGSIVEAYVLEEISQFCGLYFADEVFTRLNRQDRYNDGGFTKNDHRILIVSYPGRAIGKLPVRNLTTEELDATHYYVLLNFPEFDPFIE